MSTTIIRKKGQFTLPSIIRTEMGIEENDVLTVIPWDKKAIIVIPHKLKTEALLKQTAVLARKKGLTLEEMMAELEEIRHKA